MKKLVKRALRKMGIPGQKSNVPCNICGGTRFTLGPNDRFSPNNKYPRCTKCRSLERHRIHRKISTNLKNTFDFSKMKGLRFSNDPSFSKNWFGAFEISTYGGENSIDVQQINRNEGSYDVVIINHVLEHVPDDKKALSELFRIISDNGFIFISVPLSISQEKTEDWGYPKEELHGHFRHYGQDFSNLIMCELPNAFWIRALDVDPVTLTTDEVYLIAKTENTAIKIRHGLNIAD
jgi:SAM-dependent methyltransferase